MKSRLQQCLHECPMDTWSAHILKTDYSEVKEWPEYTKLAAAWELAPSMHSNFYGAVSVGWPPMRCSDNVDIMLALINSVVMGLKICFAFK